MTHVLAAMRQNKIQLDNYTAHNSECRGINAEVSVIIQNVWLRTYILIDAALVHWSITSFVLSQSGGFSFFNSHEWVIDKVNNTPDENMN